MSRSPDSDTHLRTGCRVVFNGSESSLFLGYAVSLGDLDPDTGDDYVKSRGMVCLINSSFIEGASSSNDDPRSCYRPSSPEMVGLSAIMNDVVASTQSERFEEDGFLNSSTTHPPAMPR